MYRFIIFLLLLFFPIALGAQQKVFIAGTGSIYNHSNKNESARLVQSRYSLTPNIGFHINKNWILGLSSNLTYTEADWRYTFNGNFPTFTYNQKTKTTGGGLFVRKRFPTTENIALYINAYANYSEDTNETNNDGDFLKEKIYELRTAGLQLGFEYRFGKRWIVTSNLGGITYVERTPFVDDFPGLKEWRFSISPRVFQVVLGYYIW